MTFNYTITRQKIAHHLSVLFFSLSITILFVGCSNGQTRVMQKPLTATAFAEKIKELPSSIILDVRTPEEFASGHLANAQNTPLGSSAFDQQIASLDPSQPIFVYCLSGGRSSAAAGKLRAAGFKEVYEMEGGLMKWRSVNLPETTDTSSKSMGMTKEEFETLLLTDKLVLVDFYADWCAPCKKMKPSLDEITTEMVDKVVVLRINADENPALSEALHIDALPYLLVYKNKKLTWSNAGYLTKGELLKQLN
jgi:thioredoxin 1